jgi:hypothetical protein
MATRAERDPAPWTGWHRRPGSAWRAVCEGESQEEVWDLLPAVVNESGDTIALPTCRHPDDRRERRKAV